MHIRVKRCAQLNIYFFKRTHDTSTNLFYIPDYHSLTTLTFNVVNPVFVCKDLFFGISDTSCCNCKCSFTFWSVRTENNKSVEKLCAHINEFMIILLPVRVHYLSKILWLFQVWLYYKYDVNTCSCLPLWLYAFNQLFVMIIKTLNREQTVVKYCQTSYF